MSTQKIQRCVACDEPTGRCEEDSIYLPPKDPNGSDLGPLCEACCDERDPPKPEPPRQSLRGFGVTITPGGARSWYVGADGVKRWANNDGPVFGA